MHYNYKQRVLKSRTDFPLDPAFLYKHLYETEKFISQS